ncbi:ATP-binding cassette domain-containing protein [Flavobacterium hydatis]|uniref:ABC transporter n=1 Tax=Flavobacterium hydatis TaxID=991 RepID=A0A086AUI8_FLAHY|nr:ATP-binding cassette domain-containing protein [Flavobacterium hydatis]KFF20352.1 ABC transporter [Flavobacterium hydatis]OXA98360.1 ABC transporter [Flavobacterium hydatis]
MKRHILEIDSIKKSFGDKIILSDVYLQCETNDIIGLLGRNGSGKSTFLKIIFGVISADFKFVRVDGVMKTKTKELMNELSYLSQDNFIPNNFSVKKAIRLSIAKERIDSFCNDEMIKRLTDKNISHLSGGELRYLEIKLVLENSSKFVLLDEPYNGLSPLMIEKVNQLIIMNSSKKGIIISDHNYRNVISISTRLVLIKDGKLNHLKDKNELIEKGYLSSEMI